MTRKIARFMMLGLAAILVGAVITGCGGGEPEAVEPTPDLQATLQAIIDATVAASIPTETPTPEPTATPTPTMPPTPNIAQTVAAMMAAQQPPTQPPPTAVPPTNTPAPTVPPTAAPSTGTNPIAGPPAIIVGKVTIGGSTAPEGTFVYGRPHDTSLPRVQDQTDEKGNYQLNITNIGTTYDLWVEGTDSTVDTDTLTRGGLQRKNLSVAQ